jgi:hypothetical protein
MPFANKKGSINMTCVFLKREIVLAMTCICHLPFAEANGKTLHSPRANDRQMHSPFAIRFNVKIRKGTAFAYFNAKANGKCLPGNAFRMEKPV